MRRFKSLLHPVVSAIVAFATLATAALFSSRGTDASASAPETRRRSTRRIGRGWKPRGVHAVPLVAVLAIGATAFAAGAGTPTGAGAIVVGDQVPHSVPAAQRATTSPAPTLPATAEAIADSVDAKQAQRVEFMKAVGAANARAEAEAAERAEAEAEARKAAETPAPQPVSAQGACGGNLPPCCVMMRESGGNPTAVNPSSGASGKWQFMPSTWANYGGYPTAASAPEAVQDERAAQLWAGGAGAGHWGGGCW